VIQEFQYNHDVIFADVNVQSIVPSLRNVPPHYPGLGGWPTIRYYNTHTGTDGMFYVQKQSSWPVCDELGDIDYLIDYIEEAGSTTLYVTMEDDDGSGKEGADAGDNDDDDDAENEDEDTINNHNISRNGGGGGGGFDSDEEEEL
jgi:hypothetical protein